MVRVAALLVVLGVLLSLCDGKDVIVDPATGIQAAVAIADDGDVIVIPNGTYSGHNNSNLMLVGRSLSFVSQTGNTDDVIIDGQNDNIYTAIQIFYNESNAIDYTKPTNISLSGITFKNGGTPSVTSFTTIGGTIYINSTLLPAAVSLFISKCTFIGGYADYGGVLYTEKTTTPINIYISESTFLDNKATYGASLALYGANTVIDKTSFVGATSHFGAIHILNATVSVVEVSLSNCLSEPITGYVTTAGFYIGRTSKVNIDLSTFTGNKASFGPAVTLFGGTIMTISNSNFTSGSLSLYGGAIYNRASTLSIIGSTFDLNEAEAGGALANIRGPVGAATTVISNSVFHQNKAARVGGAIFTDSSHVTSTDTLYVSNSASDTGAASQYGNGGAIYSFNSTLTMSKSDFVSNNANSIKGGRGGAAFLVGGSSATISNANVTANTAAYGAGFYIDSSQLSLTNGVVTGNSAKYGGAFYVGKLSYLGLVGETVKDNQGSSAGSEVYCTNGTIKLMESTITPAANRPNEKDGVYCEDSPKTICSVSGDGDWTNVCRATPTSSSSSDDSSSDGHAWKIAVLVIFVLIGTGIIAAIAIIVIRKRRRSAAPTSFSKF